MVLREECPFEVIVVFRGDAWRHSPTVQWLLAKPTTENLKILVVSTGNLAKAYNAAIGVMTSNEVIFWDPRLPFFVPCGGLVSEERCAADNLVCVLRSKVFVRNGYPNAPPPSLIYAWVLNQELVCLADFRFSREQISLLGGFDEFGLLGEYCGWDFIVRALRLFKSQSIVDYDIDLAFLGERKAKSYDLIHRYIVYPRTATSRGGIRTIDLDELLKRFMADLRESDRAIVASYCGKRVAGSADSQSKLSKSVRSPYRILLTGSFWEYHHNWLCFLNYAEVLAGSGFATFRIMLDSAVEESDLFDIDLVIISRGKVAAVKDLVDRCVARNIKTLYMIDDNWISVSQDWPDLYGQIFAAESEFMQTFKYCLEKCSFTLTYNPILLSDIEGYAKNIVSLPTSVDLTRFEIFERPEQSRRFKIGYSGSARFTSAPFEALARISRSQEVDVLIFGSIHPEHEILFADANITRLPLMDYHNYIQNIRQEGLDILLAPLDNSRTSQSKCPNKYLEITAAGAVGIYSKVEPYLSFVEDGVNGKFVSVDADAHEWEVAIIELLDHALLREISTSAREIVAAENSVEVVAPQFRRLIESILES